MAKFLVLLVSVLLVGVPAAAVPAPTAEPSVSTMTQPFVSATITVNGVVTAVEFVDLATGLTLMTTNPALIALADNYVSDADTATGDFTKDVSDGKGGTKKVEMTITVTKRPDESDDAWLKRFEKRCSAAIEGGWEPVVTPPPGS